MQKEVRLNPSCLQRGLRKVFLIMKLTAFFLLVFCLHVSARVHSQKISLSLTKISLVKAFSIIEKNTKYRFVYNDEYIPYGHKISVDAKDFSISQLLTSVLNNTQLGFRMMSENLIVIAPEYRQG